METCVYQCELDIFPIPKYFSNEIISDIGECDILISYNGLCQHFRSVWLSEPTKNHTLVKNPFKVPDGPKDFNTTKDEKFNDTVSDSTLQLTC